VFNNETVLQKERVNSLQIRFISDPILKNNSVIIMILVTPETAAKHDIFLPLSPCAQKHPHTLHYARKLSLALSGLILATRFLEKFQSFQIAITRSDD